MNIEWIQEAPRASGWLVATGPIGDRLGTVGAAPVDGLIQAWDVETGEPRWPATQVKSRLKDLAVAQVEGVPVVLVAGRHINGAGRHGIAMWDLATGSRLETAIEGRLDSLATTELAGTPVVVAGSEDGVGLWDVSTGARLPRRRLARLGRVRALDVVERDKGPAVAGGGHDWLGLWDVRRGRPRAYVPFPRGPVRAIAAGTVGGRVLTATAAYIDASEVTGGDGGEIVLWRMDMIGLQPAWSIGGLPAIEALLVSEHAGRPAIVAGGSDGMVRVIVEGEVVASVQFDGWVLGLAPAGDHRIVAGGHFGVALLEVDID